MHRQNIIIKLLPVVQEVQVQLLALAAAEHRDGAVHRAQLSAVTPAQTPHTLPC